MFEELIIRFTNANGRREVVVPAGSSIRAIFLPGAGRPGGPDLATELGLNFVAGIAPGMIVRAEDGVQLSDSALGSEGGPNFCCIVAGDLHCW